MLFTYRSTRTINLNRYLEMTLALVTVLGCIYVAAVFDLQLERLGTLFWHPSCSWDCSVRQLFIFSESNGLYVSFVMFGL